MATYKVIQDIEAEDKLVGPLTLRQCIYAAIGATSGYLGFITSSKGAAFMLIFFLPVTAIAVFFAFPWGRDQPTEIWALAKIRFLFKPRKRIWDQSGAKDLVTVTAPKHVERILTNGLNQAEVQSRLNALASTIDSRGWAVKNVNVSLGSQALSLPLDSSDRLVQASSLPQEVSSADVRASDDIMDPNANPIAQQFERMIQESSQAHRKQLQQRMNDTPSNQTNPSQNGTPVDYWFMHQVTPVSGQSTFQNVPIVSPGGQNVQDAVPQAAVPTEEELKVVERVKRENATQPRTYGHMKTIKTPEQLATEAREKAAAKAKVTPERQAAIMNYANTNDQNVATLGRRSHRELPPSDDGEVTITLR